MKRALAERAKQSAGLPTNVGMLQVQTPGANSSSPGSHSLSQDGMIHDQGPPLKIPRQENSSGKLSFDARASHQSVPVAPVSSGAPGSESQNGEIRQSADETLSNSSSQPMNASSTLSKSISQGSQPVPDKDAVTSAPPTFTASSNSMKRQRTSISSQSKVAYPVPSDDEEDDTQQSAFFLKHQNRALASELKALQYQLSLLETERDYRRQQCSSASQALHSLQATWTQMETELNPSQKMPLTGSVDPVVASAAVEKNVPMSTGTGAQVELVESLFDALSALATKPPIVPAKSREDDDGEEGEVTAARGFVETTPADLEIPEKQHLDDLSTISDNILQRANTLEQWIRSLLQKTTAEKCSDSKDEQMLEATEAVDSTDQRVMVKELGILRGQCREYKIQVAELAKARDDTIKSERKVRRSLYRLSTGRVKIGEVLKAMETSEEDGSLAAEAKMEALAQDKAASTLSASENDSKAAGSNESQNATIDSKELQNMRQQLQDLEKQLSNRDASIEELQTKLSEREQRINSLSSKALSDDDAEKVQQQQQSQNQLEKVEQELADLKEKLKETRDNWATARGDASAALKALDDLQAKHKKRWQELTEANGDADGDDAIDIPLSMEATEQAQKIIELDHKLKQALENVRQADAVRLNLKEALTMNGVLQSKLDEIKGKYAALQASRSNSTKSTLDAASLTAASSSQSDFKQIKPEKVEKLQKEHRRMRKELAAVAASKDAAKTKLERIEKERDNLMETNARLLKQSAEKDDMNAKSLSTILHLKNLTEQLTQGKASLEQQLKSAGQLSLAARLATNAKDRVAEEVIKEKEEIEKKLANSEERIQALKKELETTVSDWSEADAKISIINSQLVKTAKRNDELIAELETEQIEKRKLQDALDVAVRKASEATDKLNEFAQKEGVSSGAMASAFTVEQLNTQVAVLKNRLSCPVCHVRDKDCIIMRCRHMFCKHCVDENIQNRSRKCPSCGLKFSEKDVDDVWL